VSPDHKQLSALNISIVIDMIAICYRERIFASTTSVSDKTKASFSPSGQSLPSLIDLVHLGLIDI
jgi:hypothetical protein